MAREMKVAPVDGRVQVTSAEGVMACVKAELGMPDGSGMTSLALRFTFSA
jgi:hypothetical protein